MPVNDDLADDAILRSIRAIRAGNHIWRELNRILRRVERDLVEEVEKGATRTLRSRRAERLLREVRRLIAGGASEVQSRLHERGIELAEIEEDASLRSLDKRIPVSVDWVRPSSALLEAVALAQPFEGALLRDHLSKWSDDTIFAMQAELRSAIVIGEGVEPMQRRLRRVSDIKIKEARSIARTYTMHVTNEARALLYVENQDVIAREQWVATLDNRTCIRCASLDNEFFPVGKGQRAPLHMNCRCVRVPITRAADALRRRGVTIGGRSAANELNGEAPADMAFPQWLRRQSEDTQREVLGARRFELWQNGSSIDRFVNDENEIIPLSELSV